jgi:hypothetical protein
MADEMSKKLLQERVMDFQDKEVCQGKYYVKSRKEFFNVCYIDDHETLMS